MSARLNGWLGEYWLPYVSTVSPATGLPPQAATARQNSSMAARFNSASNHRRQPQHDRREDDQHGQMHKVCKEERDDAPEYRSHGNVPCDAVDDIDVHSDRRRQESQLDGTDDEDPELDRRRPVLLRNRQEDRRPPQHDSHAV